MSFPTSRRWIFAGVTLLGFVAFLAWQGFSPRRSSRASQVRPVAVPEVLRADLQLRQGRLYHGTATNAFTGWMLERYEGGALRSRSSISNGVLNGLSQGWHTNGHTQIQEQFQAGISHGLRTKYYPDGTKLSEVTVVNGKLEGLFRRWHPQGQLAESVELKAGVPNGISSAYFPSGSLKTRATLRDGKVIDTQSWHDGEHELSTADGLPARKELAISN